MISISFREVITESRTDINTITNSINMAVMISKGMHDRQFGELCGIEYLNRDKSSSELISYFDYNNLGGDILCSGWADFTVDGCSLILDKYSPSSVYWKSHGLIDGRQLLTDVYRLSGNDWSVLFKVKSTEYSNDFIFQNQISNVGSCGVIDVIILGDMNSLHNDMLLYKLQGLLDYN